MKFMYKRFFAYVVDMVIILMLVSFLSKISFINPQLGKYNSYSVKYQDVYIGYRNFATDFNKYYSDGKIDSDEYDKLIKKYADSSKYIEKYYSDGKITKKEHKKIIKSLTDDFTIKYKKLYYKVNSYSKVSNIILVIVMMLYFVGLNIIFNGQTLGKKIMGIRIVSSNNNDLSIVNYLIRVVVLYSPLYYLLIIIGNCILNANDFYNFASVLSNIKDYLFVIIVIMMFVRNDKRGLHDILSKTKVIDEKELKTDFGNKEKKVIDSEEN